MMQIFHVDVFSNKPFAGNGLTVVMLENWLEDSMMQQIACEFKQFETIFLKRQQGDKYAARIFTVEEELDFAGHPILGAAGLLHQEFFADDAEKTITFALKEKEVSTRSVRKNGYYEVEMNQGVPVWGEPVTENWQMEYCKALNLQQEDLCAEYPMEVVSTGLPYLLVPIRSGLEHARILRTDLEEMLVKCGAKFVYVFDMLKMEGRTWDNLGAVEDVATGSAAGPVGAYLYKHGCFSKRETIALHQGSYVGRPSVLKISCKEETDEILVAGDVVMVTKGEFLNEYIGN